MIPLELPVPLVRCLKLPIVASSPLQGKYSSVLAAPNLHANLSRVANEDFAFLFFYSRTGGMPGLSYSGPSFPIPLRYAAVRSRGVVHVSRRAGGAEVGEADH